MGPFLFEKVPDNEHHAGAVRQTYRGNYYMLKHFITGLVLLLALPASWVSASDEYRLQPGDELLISVWREEELNRQLVVLPDGRISYPLVGHVMAAGQSAEVLETLLAKHLEEFITEPQVSVSVTAVSGNVAFVFGQVNSPGPILMSRDLSVVQALALAGGFTPFASTGRIKIIREQGAEKTVLPVDYPAIERSGDLEYNHTLRAGDVIIVP
jgi:polysaccharide export outer membrane protein